MSAHSLYEYIIPQKAVGCQAFLRYFGKKVEKSFCIIMQKKGCEMYSYAKIGPARAPMGRKNKTP